MKTIYKTINNQAFTRRMLLLLLIMTVMLVKVQAQLNPLAAQYFINPYLSNPAMAGLDKGLEINLNYSRQTGDTPGSPVYQSLSVAYGAEKNVGLGLNVINDKAGLFNRTRVIGTYAYHLLFENDQKLSFGLSLGVMNEKLNNNDVVGDVYDPAIRYFADRELSIDGDFGVAYIRQNFTLQGSLPNLRSLIKNDADFEDADHPVFFAAASYKFNLQDGSTIGAIEPKVCYRGIKSYDNIWDGGVNVSLANNWLNIMSLYHSTKSATYGFGINYKSTATISFLYTTETSAQKTYGNNEFEIGLKLSL